LGSTIEARGRRVKTLIVASILFLHLAALGQHIERGLILDLNADAGVALEEGDRVVAWTNQATTFPARVFVKQDAGRDRAGSGRPTLKRRVKAIGNHNTLVFRRQELVNHDNSAFDSLTTGKGYTWFSVMTVYPQVTGLKDVNSFFGNLKNGGYFEGFWAGFNDDNTLWTGSRNGRSFGRWDANNPKLLGPKLETNRYYVVAGRMASGQGTVSIELFVNGTKPVATSPFPVNPKADPSRMAIGQERDATNHPGRESFDGEFARILIYDRPLDDREFAQMMNYLVTNHKIRRGLSR
jgi:hypothetical protein